MRLLFALTIVALFALPINAQAEDKGSGAGSSSSAGHSNQGAGAGKVNASGGTGSQGSSGGAGKVTPGPKPAAQSDTFLTLDGIKGESQDDKHKDEILLRSAVGNMRNKVPQLIIQLLSCRMA